MKKIYLIIFTVVHGFIWFSHKKISLGDPLCPLAKIEKKGQASQVCKVKLSTIKELKGK
jgi:hypothetical protein